VLQYQPGSNLAYVPDNIHAERSITYIMSIGLSSISLSLFGYDNHVVDHDKWIHLSQTKVYFHKMGRVHYWCHLAHWIHSGNTTI